MSLVKIEDFIGTVAQVATIEALNELRLTDMLNNYMYVLSIEGIQGPTPKGMIDDEPKTHEVCINKEMYIGMAHELSFVKGKGQLDTNSDDYKQSMEALGSADLKFCAVLGVPLSEEKKIKVDKEGRCWYIHNIKFKIEQGNMSLDDYVVYMFRTIADTVIHG